MHYVDGELQELERENERLRIARRKQELRRENERLRDELERDEIMRPLGGRGRRRPRREDFQTYC